MDEFDKEQANNREYVLSMVKQDGKLLDLASERLQDDEEIVMEAVKQNPISLEFASSRLKDNAKIVMESVSRVGWTACYASEKLRANKEIMLSGLKIDGQILYYVSKELRDDKEAVLAAAKTLEEKGAIVEEFDLGLVEYAIPAYYVIAAAEASSNLSRFDGVKYGYRAKDYEGLHNMYKKTRSEGFGAEVKRRIMLGSFVLSSGYYDAYYLKALRTKALIKKEFDKAFEKYDVILGPVAPTTAPKLGDSLSDPIKMYLGDIYTISVNLAGLPGISLPCGKDKNGMPIGLQLIGDCFNEKKIIQAAYTFEQTRAYEAPAIAKGGAK